MPLPRVGDAMSRRDPSVSDEDRSGDESSDEGEGGAVSHALHRYATHMHSHRADHTFDHTLDDDGDDSYDEDDEDDDRHAVSFFEDARSGLAGLGRDCSAYFRLLTSAIRPSSSVRPSARPSVLSSAHSSSRSSVGSRTRWVLLLFWLLVGVSLAWRQGYFASIPSPASLRASRAAASRATESSVLTDIRAKFLAARTRTQSEAAASARNLSSTVPPPTSVASSLQQQSTLSAAIAGKSVAPPSEFDLAFSLSLQLPVARLSLAETDLASVAAAAHSSIVGTPTTQLARTLRDLYTDSTCDLENERRYYIFSCAADFQADHEDHRLTSMLDLVRAMSIAVSSERTLLIDTSTCTPRDNPDDPSRSCCAMHRYFKPISPCRLDFSLLTGSARDTAFRGMEVGLSGASTALVDPFNDAPFSFYHAPSVCHTTDAMWSTMPGRLDGTPLSRIHVMRTLAAFMMQPTSEQQENIQRTRRNVLEQMQIQMMRAGLTAPPAAADLPPFISAYVPLSLADHTLKLSTFQTAHVPSKTQVERARIISREREAGIRAGSSAPLPGPIVPKMISAYVSIEEYVDAIRADAATHGRNMVVVWTHDHHLQNEVKEMPWKSRSLVIEELRTRLPHLLLIDAFECAMTGLTPPPPERGNLASSLSALSLLSSGSFAIGSYTSHVFRLVSFLMPAPLSASGEADATERPILPIHALDAATITFGCDDGAFHDYRRETLPGRTKPTPFESALGRILFPPVADVRDDSSPRRAGMKVRVPTHHRFDSLHLPRVKVLVLHGARHSGVEQLGQFFDRLALPRHERLSALMSTIFSQPLKTEEYDEAKLAFLDALTEEVSARLDAPNNEQPRTEADRVASDVITNDRGSAAAARSSFARDTVLDDVWAHPAPVIRLESVLSVNEHPDKVMLHLDLSLLARILTDFAGASGARIDLQFIIAHRPLHPMVVSSLKRAPISRPVFLHPEWDMIWDLRVLRDQLSITDGEMRGIHPSMTCVIDWDQSWDRPEHVGAKLASFLGLEVRTVKGSQDGRGQEVRYLALAPDEVATLNHHDEPLPGDDTTGFSTHAAQPLSVVFRDWFHKDGGREFYAQQDHHSDASLNPSQEKLVNEWFPEVHGARLPHLEFASRVRTVQDRNERLVGEERRKNQFVRKQVADLEATAGNAKDADENNNANRAARLLAMAASGATIDETLAELQFPSASSSGCSASDASFLIFDGFFNLSSMPRVYPGESHESDQLRELPVLDQCSLSGAFDVSAQLHALARTLSVALLTGRILIVPEVPNTVAELIDISKISACTLADAGYRLAQYTEIHGEIAGQPAMQHRIGQYYLEPIGITAPVATDPLDLTQRIVRHTAIQYSFHWLLHHTSHHHRLVGTVAPQFEARALGVQEYVSALTSAVSTPNERLLAHKLTTEESLGLAGSSRPRVGILLPLETSPSSFHPAPHLAASTMHHLDLLGYGDRARLGHIDLLLSHSCSRNGHLGTGGTGRGLENAPATGFIRGSEWEQYREAFEVSQKWTKSSNGDDHVRTAMRVPIERHRDMADHLQREFQARSVDGGSAPPLRIRSSRRNSATYASVDVASTPFASLHQLVLADIFVDILLQAGSDDAISSHVHEEGLVVAEMRHARAVRDARKRQSDRTSSSTTTTEPMPLASFHDLYGADFLRSFERNEEIAWKLAMFHALYEVEYSAVVQATPDQTPAVTTATVAERPFWDGGAASAGDPQHISPPSLQALAPPSYFVTPKRVFSSAVRFVLIAGIEGVGHHFIDTVLSVTRQYNDTQAVAGVDGNEPPVVNFNKRGARRRAIPLTSAGRVFSSQLRSDPHLSGLVYHVFTHDSIASYESAKRQLDIRLRVLVEAASHAPRSDAGPLVYFLNMQNSGTNGMQSYPNDNGLDRSMHHPDLNMMARLFEASGADVRVVTLVRAPGASFTSTLRRGHGSGVSELAKTDANVLFQARTLHDNLAVLDAELRSIDPNFHVRIELEHTIKHPYANARLLSTTTGLNERLLARALIQVGHGFSSKPPSGWQIQYTQRHVEIARDHFSFASSLGLSEGAEYNDGAINWPADTTRSFTAAARTVREMVSTSKAPRVPVSASPSLDELDTDARTSMCASLSSLVPMMNRGERQTLPIRVALRSLDDSGDAFLRYLLEQSTGIWTGSVDRYALSRWPASTFVPRTIIDQFATWSFAGQTSVQSDITCIACQYEVTWLSASPFYRPSFRVEQKDAGSYAAEDEQAAEGRSTQVSEVKPPFSAPIGGRIVLLRNPLDIAVSIAVEWARALPLFTWTTRYSTQPPVLNDWTRRAVQFMRDELVSHAMRIVATAYPTFLQAEGLLPTDFATTKEQFSSVDWQQEQGGRAMFVRYEQLESRPLETVLEVLDFIGLQPRPDHLSCVQSVLEQLELVRPTRFQDGLPDVMSPHLLFAHSLRPTADSFTQLFPWMTVNILPESPTKEFVEKMRPYLKYFGHDTAVDAMVRQAEEVGWPQVVLDEPPMMMPVQNRRAQRPPPKKASKPNKSVGMGRRRLSP